MSNILNTTAAIIVLRPATMGSDQAPAANYHAWSRPNDAVLGKSHSGYSRSFRPLQRRDTLITQPQRPIVCRALTSLAPSKGEVSLA